MIKLEEKQTKKLPGKTSIFVDFEYKAELVDVMHQVPNAIFHKKDKLWETPLTELSRLITFLHNYDDIDLIMLKDKPKQEDKVYSLLDYKTTPYDYQLDGIQFGLNHDRCLILDQPGLGKTIQCIYIAQERYYKGEIEHCLIVCGLNTLKFNWKKEIEQHSDLSAKILGERINKKGKLVVDGVDTRLQQLKEPIEEFFVITNIETLRDDRVLKELNKGVNKFGMIVADEIHKMNNIVSAQGKNFSKLKSKYKIGLTGTFLVNSPLDAYMALKWVDIDRSTATNFKYFYSVYGGRFGNELIGYKNLEILKDQLSDISIRRTKDILNLPEKNYIHELLEMDDKQSKFYNNIVERIIEEVDKVNIDKNNVLALTTRLRQSTSDPSILTTENIKSAKLLRAKELVQEIISQGEKVIVYTTFKQPLYTLAEELKKYKPLVCTGDTKEEEVWKRVDKFQTDNEHYLMLATIQKMGTGITLTRASYVIFIDSAWTRADNEQAEDRIHRIGAKKPCFYYYLWTKDTYDENVRALVDKKDALSTYINDDELTLDKMETLKKYVTDFKENKISK